MVFAMSDVKPIGILDSGLGGLTVVKELLRVMPKERIIYIGDTFCYPYRNRPVETIRDRTLQMVDILLKEGIKLLVVACHTISALVMEAIEQHLRPYDIPIVGAILPQVRAAVLRTAEKKIGVIGTTATINSGIYSRSFQRIDSSIKVYEVATPILIPLVEELCYNNDISRVAVQNYLYDLTDIGIDCLVLGCNYFTPLMEVIQETIGTSIEIIENGLWIAKEVEDTLITLGCKNREEDSTEKGKKMFIFSEAPFQREELITLLLGERISPLEIIIKNFESKN